VSDEETIGYAEALAELDEILADLDDDDLDIDVLGDRVERAAVLIASCRARIEAARLRVTEIVATIGEPGEGDG
jgi:exodeoxyribonuclease VII small subunit